MPYLSSRTVSVNKAKCLLLALATSVIFTAGCGMGVMSTASSPDEPLAASKITGKAMGGSTPIVGATATLWETANNGTAVTGLAGGYYSGTATVLQTTTTGTNGSFSFTTPCYRSYDQAYITFSGGNSGGGQSNPNILLMAALGPCEQLSQIPFVIVNEVTTVAAAYTLAGFTSISSSTAGGVTTTAVNITASPTNYATGVDGGAGSTGTIYHPVGLQHAFQNANNLADVPAGIAYGYLPTQGLGGTAVMPTALINSVANVLQACTNSTGATPEITFTGSGGTLTSSTIGTSDTLSGTLTIKADGTTYNLPSANNSWSNVSQATVLSAVQAIPGLSTSTFSGGVLTITDTNASPSLTLGNTDPQYTGSGSASTLLDVPATPNTCGTILAAAVPLSTGTPAAPTNILQAALNIARNPYMGGAGKAATFLGLSAGSGANPYSPTITPTGAGTTTATPHDLSAAIFYPATIEAAQTGGAVGNGSTLTGISPIYLSASTLDANDNFYVLEETGGAMPYYNYQMFGLASNGAILGLRGYCTSSTYNQSSCSEVIGDVTKMEADALGNLWVMDPGLPAGSTTATGTSFTTAESGLYQISSSSFAFIGPGSTSTQPSTYPTPNGVYSLALDKSDNIWTGTYLSTTGNTNYLYELPNSSAGTNTFTSVSPGAASTMVTVPSTKYLASYQLSIDSDQNVYSTLYNTSSAVGDAGMYVDPNQALTTVPSYPVTSLSAKPTYPTTGSYAGVSQTPTAAADYSTGVATDSAGNIYYGTGGGAVGIYVTQPVYNSGNTCSAAPCAITGFATPVVIAGAAISTSSGTVNLAISQPYPIQVDGDNAVWFADYSGDAPVRVYGTTTSASVLAYYPCVGSTCYAKYAKQTGLYGAKEVYIDSTGTVWVMPNGSTSNDTEAFAEIFGIAAPSYPLRQAGRAGQMPQ